MIRSVVAFLRHLFRSNAGETAPLTTKDYVPVLLDHSAKLIRYQRQTSGANTVLRQAFHSLDDSHKSATVQSDQVTALEDAFSESRKALDLETWIAVERGWAPGQKTRSSTITSIFMTFFVLLLVIGTGKLTNIHTSGHSLLQELEELSSPTTVKTYQRLLRDMAQAWYQANHALNNPATADAGNPASAPRDSTPASAEQTGTSFLLPAQFDLARNVYFDSESEIGLLAQRIVIAREGTYHIGEQLPLDNNEEIRWCVILSYFMPIPQGVLCPSGTNAGSQPAALSEGETGQSDQLAPAGPVLASTAVNPTTAGHFEHCLSNSINGEWRAEISSIGKLPSDLREYDNRLRLLSIYLYCRGTLPFESPTTFRTAAEDLARLKAAMLPLSLLVLPALYGATGGAMSIMRSRFDHGRPNPSFSRSMFRIVFGAVIGAIVVWFATPDSVIQDQLSALGMSLLALAFVLGFAQTKLFEFFDRVSANLFREVGPKRNGNGH